MVKVTTSWDDGDILDLRVASLLDASGIKGTFYIAESYRKDRLSESDILALSHTHEIGAHTLTHPDLRKISPEMQRREIGGSKKWLENIIGAEVGMFCYPSGRYDGNSAVIAKEVGFIGARTTQMGRITKTDPFMMPTTLSVYPLPFRKKDANRFDWRHLLEPLQQRGPIFHELGLSYWDMRSFESLARSSFELARKKNGIFHLWGHSWEIEKYGMWDELERVCRYIGGQPDCEYVTNGELV